MLSDPGRVGRLGNSFLRIVPPGPPPPVSVPQHWLGPTSAGLNDGSSAANRKALSAANLNAAITAMKAVGGEVSLVTDGGNYTAPATPYEITVSGTSNAERTPIRGRTTANALGFIRVIGTRGGATWTIPADPETITDVTGWTGEEVFLLSADNLIFEGFRWEHVQHPFRTYTTRTNITFLNHEFLNIRRFFEPNTTGAIHQATNNVLYDNIDGDGYSKSCIRAWAASNGVTVRNCRLDSRRQDRDNFAMGVHCDDTATNILIEDNEIGRITDTVNSYRNGDAIVAETNVSNISILRNILHGCTDAGIDIKATTGVVITDNTIYDNKRNVRFWGNITPGNISGNVVYDPRHRGGTGLASCYQVNTPATAITITGGQITMSRYAEPNFAALIDLGDYSGITVTLTGQPLIGTATAPRNLLTGTSTVVDNTGGVVPTRLLGGSVSGTVQVGQTLTAADPLFTGMPEPTVARKWRNTDVDIPGATGTTYMPVSGDQGDMLDVTWTATNASGAVTYTLPDFGPVAAGTQPWLLTDTPSLLFLLDVPTLPASGAIQTWEDGSAANLDFTQATLNNRPNVDATAASINNEKAALYDGGDWLLSNASPSQPASVVFAAVVKPDAIDLTRQIISSIDGGSTSIADYIRAVAGQIRLTMYSEALDGYEVAGPTMSVDSVYIIVGRLNGTAMELRVNGTVYTGTAGAAKRVASGIIGIGANGAGGNRFAGHIRAALMTSSVTNDTIDRIEGRIHHDLGLTANLPAPHPYKTNPPTVP